MAPKIDWPARSNISMRMRSPNAMNGVTGLPLSMVSRTRRSAMQEQPTPASRLATVPEPKTVPASRCRVRAAWAMSWPKSKVRSVAALGWPNSLPFKVEISGRVRLPPSPGAPSSSGGGGGVGMSELPAVQGRDQRQVELAAIPGVAQLVGGDGDGCEGRRGFAVEKAETLGQLGDHAAC